MQVRNPVRNGCEFRKGNSFAWRHATTASLFDVEWPSPSIPKRDPGDARFGSATRPFPPAKSIDDPSPNCAANLQGGCKCCERRYAGAPRLRQRQPQAAPNRPLSLATHHQHGSCPHDGIGRRFSSMQNRPSMSRMRSPSLTYPRSSAPSNVPAGPRKPPVRLRSYDGTTSRGRVRGTGIPSRTENGLSGHRTVRLVIRMSIDKGVDISAETLRKEGQATSTLASSAGQSAEQGA
jgi:hypothetical protein